MNITPLMQQSVYISKLFFDNLKNTGICVAIFVAAAWISTNNNSCLFCYNQILFALLFVIGIILFIANGFDGVLRIKSIQIPTWGKALISFSYIAVYIPVFFSTLSYAITHSSKTLQ